MFVHFAPPLPYYSTSSPLSFLKNRKKCLKKVPISPNSANSYRVSFTVYNLIHMNSRGKNAIYAGTESNNKRCRMDYS